jgi:hypothetical protein
MRMLATVVLLAVAFSAATGAHHSFAVFFDDTKNITVKGTVTEFRFTNPHGVITIAVKKDGREEAWKAETNAPTILTRRGWTKTSLKAGDVVTIDGWPSRDGKPYMRMRRVMLADGTVLGAPASATGTDPSGERR